MGSKHQPQVLSSFSPPLPCPLPLQGTARGPEALGSKVELAFHFL